MEEMTKEFNGKVPNREERSKHTLPRHSGSRFEMLNAKGEDTLLENEDANINQAIKTHLQIAEDNNLKVECNYIIDNNTEVSTQNNGDSSLESRLLETLTSQQ